MRELSLETEMALKASIAEATPYVSEVLSIGVIKDEFEGNHFQASFDDLKKKYSSVRRLRRDGNCFYRAFLFQLFEHFILSKETEKGKAEYDKFLKILTDSKADLVTVGYDEIAIEDFYDTTLDEVKKLADVTKEKAHEHLIKTLANNEIANYIIMYVRFLAAAFLKKNAILYEGFIGNVEDFCNREVEQLDVECDHPQIMAITGYFELGVEVN